MNKTLVPKLKLSGNFNNKHSSLFSPINNNNTSNRNIFVENNLNSCCVEKLNKLLDHIRKNLKAIENLEEMVVSI